ncbi:unnamed protein product [Lupinus luteus]|uniref:RNA methyltransferase n=1 Tax=Lupinus luteus TaxID=3873 RepID=A0AAV1WST0_LUPLU
MENKEKSKAESQKQKQEQNNSKKRKQVFPYGNYKSYYGYRIGQGTDEDPRMKVLRKEWFEGKECLDIGCNSGIITIQIAQKFGCRSILGIDIDSGKILINSDLRDQKGIVQGGIFVLEPQPWKSYESNRHVSEIGFRTVEDITSGLTGSKTGFNRPILVFRK